MSLHVGDALTVLRSLPDAVAQTCVTSPPYWGLRDYGVDGQLGLESTPEGYVDALVAVFREVRRVLRDDGTLWLNLGDTYASAGGEGEQGTRGQRFDRRHTQERLILKNRLAGLKPKDLVGIPWRVAFALQADGWWLRSDIIWAKPNPMPESVTDRPTKAHEYIFLLAKGERYYYDAEAIKEPMAEASAERYDYAFGGHKAEELKAANENGIGVRTRTIGMRTPGAGRNKRSVWTVTTQPYPEAHFATFPPDLIKPCILAGSRPGDTVLDPFAGAGTTLYVAKELNREAIGIELNPAYIALAERRTRQEVLRLAGSIHAPASAERRAEPHPE